ncbi:MAG: response regulator transcription factor [Kiritimatiellae bacterium]|nr:response regulator transcription factor [Kiritimatiellia bacterium]
MPRAEILIAEDEPSARRGFRALFEGEGYAVRTARDGEEALAKFRESRPDAVLLDVMMPKMNGIIACAEIRKSDPLVPILFFTAMPSDVGAVRALGLGADDYIDKAKSPDELLARVAAVLRRASVIASDKRDKLSLGGVTVDFATMTASGDGVSEELTKSESFFLRLLASERGRCFSFDEIFAALRGEGYIGDDNAVRCIAKRLKAKLGRAGELIANARGVGYKLVK